MIVDNNFIYYNCCKSLISLSLTALAFLPLSTKSHS
jgi:hypothetical protein